MDTIHANFLEFEKPISNLKARIVDLTDLMKTDKVDVEDDIKKLEEKLKNETKKIYSRLNDWQISQVARHPRRPQTLDYIRLIFADFIEIHGDRQFADDRSIIGGIARIGNQSIVFIGQQKGRQTKEKIYHNFGMPKPEGYRKALRLMKLAERFSLPIVTFVDTSGAYPGIGAEKRNQAEAIATNLLVMSQLRCPIVTIVIGEGGSGGALALAVSDKVLMLEFSIYSVISPEGCSSILWKNSDNTENAARSLALTSSRLLKLGIIDQVIKEPLGAAHTEPKKIAVDIKEKLIAEINQLLTKDIDEVVKERQNRYLNIGSFNI